MIRTTKQDVLSIIEAMPNDASLEDIMYELYFRRRVEQGIRESEAGMTMPHEEVMRDVERWLRSAGQAARDTTSKT